jgi:hypothetical protein
MFLKLSPETLPQWKAELRKEIKERFSYDHYDKSLPDEEWLELYRGETVPYAVSCEVESWEPE